MAGPPGRLFSVESVCVVSFLPAFDCDVEDKALTRITGSDNTSAKKKDFPTVVKHRTELVERCQSVGTCATSTAIRPAADRVDVSVARCYQNKMQLPDKAVGRFHFEPA